MKVAAVFLIVLTFTNVRGAPQNNVRLVADNYDPDKPDLVLRNVLNVGGFTFPAGQLYPVSIKIALNAAKASGKLIGYNIVADVFDDECDFAKLKNTINYFRLSYENKSESVVPILLGPICPGIVYTGKLSKFFNFIDISSVTMDIEPFRNRKLFENLFLATPSYEIFYKAIPALMESQGWRNIFVISEATAYWGVIEDVLFLELGKRNMTLLGITKIPVGTESLPSPDLFEMLVQDARNSGARIFVTFSTYFFILACWLHRFGLYGAGYVHIVMMFNIFHPNVYIFYPWCKPPMLYEIMKCTVAISNDYPVDWHPDRLDSLGITGRFYDHTLRDNIKNAHHQAAAWYYMRGFAYEQLSLAIIVMDEVERKLNQSGETWKNWLTGTENFKNNGTYIPGLIKDIMPAIKFHGMLVSTNSTPITSRTGSMGFYQFHYEKENDIDLDTVKLQYFALSINGSFSVNNEYLRWRTKNGQPPYDMMRYFSIEVSRMSVFLQVVICSVSILIVLANIVMAGLNFRNRKNHPDLICDIICRAGAILVVIKGFLAFLTTTGDICKLTVLLGVIGLTLIFAAIWSKLQIAYLSYLQSTKEAARSNKNITIKTKRQRNPGVTTQNIMSLAPVELEKIRRNVRELSRGSILFLLTSVTMVLTVNTTLVLIFALHLGSVDSQRYNHEVEYATDDQSTAYQYFSMVCIVKVSNLIQQVLAVLILCILGVISLACVGTAVLIPKNVIFPNVANVNRFKWLSYSMILTFVGGCLSLWIISSSGNLSVINSAWNIIEIIIGIAISALLGHSGFHAGTTLQGKRSIIFASKKA